MELCILQSALVLYKTWQNDNLKTDNNFAFYGLISIMFFNVYEYVFKAKEEYDIQNNNDWKEKVADQIELEKEYEHE